MSTILINIVCLSLVVGLAYKLVGCLVVWLTQRQLMDVPNERSSHTIATPRGGGLVIIGLGIAAVLLIAIQSPTPKLFAIVGVLWAGWAYLSWADDTLNLPAKQRFSIQFGLAIASVVLIGWISDLQWSQHNSVELGGFGVVVSVIGLVWIANLYNFMDGIDGMAASQAIIASITFGFWFFAHGGNELALVSWIVAAASYGFLLHNWQPAKVFMGDVGSIGLGVFFGLLLIIAHNRYAVPVLSSVILMFVFIADTMLTLARRALHREPLLQAHRSHYYQRLVIAGCSHRQVVLIYIAAMIVCSLAATVALYNRDLLLPIFAVVVVASLFSAALCAQYAKAKQRAVDSDRKT